MCAYTPMKLQGTLPGTCVHVCACCLQGTCVCTWYPVCSDHTRAGGELGWFPQPSKDPDTHSPWPSLLPTCIAHCSPPERGGAEDLGPFIQGVPRAAVPGAPQPLTSPPGLRLVTPCGFFPSWKLETPGSASPAPKLSRQKIGKG